VPSRLRAARAHLAGLVLLGGCGLLQASDPTPDYIRFPDTARTVDGEARDAVTLAPVPDAEVELSTERPGYSKRVRADPGGRFSVDFSGLREAIRPSVPEQIIMGAEAQDVLVGWVSLRAVAGDRCSRAITWEGSRPPSKPVLLLMEPCPPIGALPGRGSPQAR